MTPNSKFYVFEMFVTFDCSIISDHLSLYSSGVANIVELVLLWLDGAALHPIGGSGALIR